MMVGVDGKVCRKVNCEHMEKNDYWDIITCRCMEDKEDDYILGVDGRIIPEYCPYKAIMLTASKNELEYTV